MDDLINLLHNGKHSLVVANGDVCTFDRRGIADLYDLWRNDPGFLDGASIADKVVGKGAAALVILGHAAEIYADIISDSALELFQGYPLKVSFGQKVPDIINRMGNGICPVEVLCRDCKTATECLPFIQNFINDLEI